VRIEIDWALCDGNGVCAVEAPKVFDLDDDDDLLVLQESPAEELRGSVEAAARACPKRAITLVEADR
jgi:ferredoxin